MCDVCSKVFNRKNNLRDTANWCIIQTEHVGKDNMKRSSCIYPNCKATFYHKTKKVKHLEKEHLIPCESDQLEFETEKQILIWKEKEEANIYVYFSDQYGSTTGDIYRYKYYTPLTKLLARFVISHIK